MFCDRCCTTISPGPLTQPCPAIISPLMMCLTASGSHTGHGMECRSNTGHNLSLICLSSLREAGGAVSGDVVHAPDEAFGTVLQSAGLESDGRAALRGPRSGLHT